MKKYLLLIIPLIILLTGCGKSKIKLGTGNEGGNYYGYGVNLANNVLEETKYKMDTVTTNGSVSNIRLISQGFLDMALVQSDSLENAINGKKEFSEGSVTNIKALKTLFTESVQIVASKSSGINNIEDLENKKISLGEENSGIYNNALDILNAYGINYNEERLSFNDSALKLKNGDIDAFFVTASYPTTSINELLNEMDLKILSINNSVIENILLKNNAYQRVVIPKNTYKNQDEDIITIGVSCVLIARDNLNQEICDSVISVLERHNDHLQEISFGNAIEPNTKKRFVLSLNMYITLAIAVLVLYLGKILRKKISILERFCIPAPVIGGLLFAIISCILYATGLVEIQFDETFKNICMMIFFTSVGFQANVKILKKGGLKMIIFLGCVITLIFSQNLIAVGLSKIMGVNSFIGLSTGSISMVGGHGTSGAFGLVLEDLGLNGATTICTTAATFGLVLGSLIGGPIGNRLIKKHNLYNKADEDTTPLIEEEEKHRRTFSKYAPAAYQIAIAMGIGTIISLILSKTGITFPNYIGAMIVAAIIRNASEYTNLYEVHMGEINDIGGICLSLFLGIAMITLRLWELSSLALPLVVLLLAQTIFMILFSYFVVYNAMGRNYDAAILAAGTCGFGMGATPNAMANMQSVAEKYGPSVQAFILVPIVGSMFADFINSLVITLFINIL